MHDLLLILSPFVAGFVLGSITLWLLMRSSLKSEAHFSDQFKAIAADTLRQNNESFLQLAESRLKQSEQSAQSTLEKKVLAIDELVKPVKESLQRMDVQIHALEVKRAGAYNEVMEMVKTSHETQQQLRNETSQLLQALRTSNTRGRWGEIQLRRILEMTGMSAHTKDFSVQQSFNSDDGVLRPDFIVHLPSDRSIIIDSKVPLISYLDASQTSDENVRVTAMKQHAFHVREHVKLLSAKAYWEQVEGTPEFVLLFMPGDHFLSAALDYDPDLMDFSIQRKVILATPMTLVALLRTVAYGWRQENVSDNVRKIGALGADLYNSLSTMTNHIVALGNKLGGCLESYNSMIGSLERNVLNKARRLKEFGAAKDGKALPEALDSIDLQPRSLVIEDSSSHEDAA